MRCRCLTRSTARKSRRWKKWNDERLQIVCMCEWKSVNECENVRVRKRKWTNPSEAEEGGGRGNSDLTRKQQGQKHPSFIFFKGRNLERWHWTEGRRVATNLLGKVNFDCVLNEAIATGTDDKRGCCLDTMLHHHVRCNATCMEGHLKGNRHRQRERERERENTTVTNKICASLKSNFIQQRGQNSEGHKTSTQSNWLVHNGCCY